MLDNRVGKGEHNAESVTVLEADLDGDGKKDILEYDLDNRISDSPNTNSLTLYRMEGDVFAMMYSQPRFDVVGYSVDIEVLAVRYKGEVFLLFKTDNDVTYSETDIYWLREWQLVGKCSVLSIWKSVKAEEMADDSFSGRKYIREVWVEDVSAEAGYETYAEKICRDAPIIADEGEARIVWINESLTVEKDDAFVGYFWGSAEDCLSEQVIRKEADEEINAFVERYDGNSGITRETDAQTLYRFWSGAGQMFQSDINNDGEMEMYVKKSGIYEPHGESVLVCYMESGGRETNFVDMCGLDIWEGELIPKMFWVEEADGRNLTFLLYQSADEWSFEIVGYDIDGGRYSEILKVKGHAVVECTYEYEWKERGKTENLPYGVRMAYNDIEHVVLYGMEDEEKQERINREIEGWIRNEIETGSLQGHYADRVKPAQYTLYRATEEELVVRYEYLWWYDETGDECNWADCWFRVDMDSESCTETGSVGWDDVEDNLW